MATPVPREVVAGICAATLTIAKFCSSGETSHHWQTQSALRLLPDAIGERLNAYLFGPGQLLSLGLLALRLTIGLMMIHLGQDKLADIQVFANNYAEVLGS